MTLGIWQIVLILVIVLIIFGAGKLPSVMGDLGKGVKSFKDGMNEAENPQPKAQATKTASVKKAAPKKKAKKSVAKKAPVKKTAAKKPAKTSAKKGSKKA